MKKTATILLLICFLYVNFNFTFTANAQTYETFTVKDNDKVIEFPKDFQPIKYWLKDDGYYVYLIPLKPIVEYFGCTYSYDEKTGDVTVINPKYDHKVVFPVKEDRLIQNGIEIDNVMYSFFTKRINGKVYIKHDELYWIFYRKYSELDSTNNVITLYDDPIIEIPAYYNDCELIFKEGKTPYLDDENFYQGKTAAIPVKEMLEFMGYSVSVDMNKKVMEIKSNKGVIKIEFNKELAKRFDIISYDVPSIYFNGKQYNDWYIKLFSRGGTLYSSISDIVFVLNDFIGIENYYQGYWSFIKGQIIWYDKDYLKAKEAGNNTSFSDVKTTDWFYNNVTKLAKDGLISGYPDKTFKPMGNIKVGEFIKILMTSLGYDLYPVKGDYWARNFINKAIETGIIDEDEFDNYDRPITRGEMARMILRAGAEEEITEDHEKYSSKISDYSTLEPEENEIATKIFSLGIITGFPDGSFGFHKNATRAEACAIITRFLNAEERMLPEL